MSDVGADRPRLDEVNQCLWRGDRRVDLSSNAFRVLRHLVQRPQQLVTKSELLDAVWSEAHVAEGVLSVTINELRHALHDDARQPRCIETVHRRGYRWIGALAPAESPPVPAAAPGTATAGGCVGRETALAELQQAFARATAGHRQLVFVTGEPGIGKTTLIVGSPGTELEFAL